MNYRSWDSRVVYEHPRFGRKKYGQREQKHLNLRTCREDDTSYNVGNKETAEKKYVVVRSLNLQSPPFL